MAEPTQADIDAARACCPKSIYELCNCYGSGVSGYSGFPCGECGGSGGLPPDWLVQAFASHAEAARADERRAIVEWLRGEVQTNYTDPQYDIGINLANAIERLDHKDRV